MTATTRDEITTEQRLGRVDALDLEPIAYKLTHPETGEQSLTLADADHRIGLYRKFLKLHVLYPNTPIVPSTEIDQVWHTHILDTGKYADDCDHIFGFFLHHFPYLGMRGDTDVTDWRAKCATTHELFRTEFGTDLAGEDASGCGVRCVPCGDCDHASTGQRPRPDRTAVVSGVRGALARP